MTASTPRGSKRFQVVDRRTAQHAGDEIALGAVGIGNADELNAGKPGQNPGVVRTHCAHADDADP